MRSQSIEGMKIALEKRRKKITEQRQKIHDEKKKENHSTKHLKPENGI